MTAGAPWSVKGIDPKAREVAKDLARRSGMTLGELLNRLILEDEELSNAQADFAQADQAKTTRRDAEPDPFAPAALAAPTREAYREPYREDPRESGFGLPPRFRAPEHPADEIGRVAAALERLSERIEAAERNSTLAVTGIDQSVRGVIARLETAERDQISVAARFEGVVDDLKTDQARTAERLRRVEQEAHGPRSAEAMRALEGALGKVASHLYDGEARTRQTVAGVEARIARMETEGGLGHNQPPVDIGGVVDAVVSRIGERLESAEARTAEAIETLGASFSALDGRLGVVEKTGGASDRRLEALAADLSRRMEAARTEMAQKLRESAEGRFDRIESRLAAMASHVTTAEQRSAQAIERMGREVAGIADTMGRKVQESEKRNAAVIEQVGGEVARMASAMEQRVGRADQVQAQALEKLGGEIARITERLAERIANAERRNALAIDDVGEQVARVTERISQRSERSNSELAERIRLSEERTARLLEEARERIDASLASNQRRLNEQSTPAGAASAARVSDLPSPFTDDPFAPPPAFAPSPAFSAPSAFAPPPAFTPPQALVSAAQIVPEETFTAPQGFEAAAFPAPEPEAPAFDDEDFAAADGFEALDAEPLDAEPFNIEPVDARSFDALAPETETVVAEPDRASVEPWEEKPAASAPVSFTIPMELADTQSPAAEARALSTKEVIEQARAAARAAQAADKKGKKAKPEKLTPLEATSGRESNSMFGAFGKARNKKRAGAPLQTALMFSGAAAALGAGVAAYYLGVAEPTGAPSARVMQARNAGAATTVAGSEADTTPAARAQTAVTPAGMDAGTASAMADVQRSAGILYADARQKLEAKNPAGVDPLKRAANLGYTPAQFYLSKLYENGEVGVAKNIVEARRWAERAAEGGDRQAMHNMGLFYHQGEGGPKNATTAAQWFRKAAELGLVDSQYNLAQLYEAGSGVPQNAAEAYKWYLIASRAGDVDSKAAATRLKGDLTVEAQSAAERSAIAFRSAAPNASQTASLAPAAAVGSTGTALAQRALNRLGYYQGPTDGSASPALGMAVAAYQRDQNLRATGNLDTETSSRLAVYAR